MTPNVYSIYRMYTTGVYVPLDYDKSKSTFAGKNVIRTKSIECAYEQNKSGKTCKSKHYSPFTTSNFVLTILLAEK